MLPRRPVLALLAALVVLGGGAFAVAQNDPKQEGRIGPFNGVQPNGRLLKPEGKLSERLGNLPTGGALTQNGRFYWTLSAGRGKNDIRIVEVFPKVLCFTPKGRRRAQNTACKAKREARIGKVVQTIEMPGLSGGIAMHRDNQTAYVSGTPESGHKDQQVADDVPGKDGDVVHVLKYDGVTGQARREGVIDLGVPPLAPSTQNSPQLGLPGFTQAFPPGTDRRSWPRDLALSRDGGTLLVSLNLGDAAAIVDTASKKVRYVNGVGTYPYGAAITPDGKLGLVGSETSGAISVIDMARGEVVNQIQVGPHLSHPEGITIDPKGERAYVAVTHQDVVAVIDLKTQRVERTLSVGRPEGIGTAPVDVTVTRDGKRLMVPLSGSDELAVFALPGSGEAAARGADARRAESVLEHEGKRGVEEAKNAREEILEYNGEEAEERAEAEKEKRPVAKAAQATDGFVELGRIPVGSYPVDVAMTPKDRKLVWLAAKGIGVGPNPRGPNPVDPRDTDDGQENFQYLPKEVFGFAGILNPPSPQRLRELTPRASEQVRPIAGQKAPEGSPIAGDGPSEKIKNVFYVVRENRTYDQIFGAEPRGDGDPKLELFGEEITPNAHALARRFPLLDHVFANSEASIDGHFWTSAAAVSDYVVKNWHANYANRKRPYDFGVYSVTWPSQRFLFDQAEEQGISYFNFGEAIAGTVPLTDKDRSPEETREVLTKFSKSDLGVGPDLKISPANCFPNDASSGGTDVIDMQDVFDSTLPAGAKPGSKSRIDCFRRKFATQLQTNSVPAFTYITLPNDHTAGTKPGQRTPQAMVAENDLALGQLVETISKSPIWKQSLILVIEDDSQNGADHVDAHRIPAFAISPYAKRGAVIHTRYDFLSFIRTMQQAIGMKPLNLFDALATPMYDVFNPDPENAEPYDALPAKIDLLKRNGPKAPNARLSQRLNINAPDRVPQRILDKILWQAVHGAGSQPPPPGPNSSPLDEPAARLIERGDFRRYDEFSGNDGLKGQRERLGG